MSMFAVFVLILVVVYSKCGDNIPGNVTIYNECNNTVSQESVSEDVYIICDNECESCDIYCNGESVCAQAKIYSAADNTNIWFNGERSGEDTSITVGDTGDYPDTCSASDFNNTNYGSVNVYCNGESGCQGMTIEGAGNFDSISLEGIDVNGLSGVNIETDFVNDGSLWIDCGPSNSNSESNCMNMQVTCVSSHNVTCSGDCESVMIGDLCIDTTELEADTPDPTETDAPEPTDTAELPDPTETDAPEPTETDVTETEEPTLSPAMEPTELPDGLDPIETEEPTIEPTPSPVINSVIPDVNNANMTSVIPDTSTTTSPNTTVNSIPSNTVASNNTATNNVVSGTCGDAITNGTVYNDCSDVISPSAEDERPLYIICTDDCSSCIIDCPFKQDCKDAVILSAANETTITFSDIQAGQDTGIYIGDIYPTQVANNSDFVGLFTCDKNEFRNDNYGVVNIYCEAELSCENTAMGFDGTFDSVTITSNTANNITAIENRLVKSTIIVDFADETTELTLDCGIGSGGSNCQDMTLYCITGNCTCIGECINLDIQVTIDITDLVDNPINTSHATQLYPLISLLITSLFTILFQH